MEKKSNPLPYKKLNGLVSVFYTGIQRNHRIAPKVSYFTQAKMSAPYYTAMTYNETTTAYKLRIFASYGDVMHYIKVQEASILDDYELVQCHTNVPHVRPNGLIVKGNVGLLDNYIQIMSKLFANNNPLLYSAAIVDMTGIHLISFQDDFSRFMMEICSRVEGIMPHKIQQQVQTWNQSHKKHGSINFVIGDYSQTLILAKNK